MFNILNNKKNISRRIVLLKSVLAVTFLEFLGGKSFGQYIVNARKTSYLKSSKQKYSPQFYTDLERILMGSVPNFNNNLKLEIPEYAENGKIVPFKIIVNNSMDASNYVMSLHLLSTNNPNAWVASFYLNLECGKAEVSGRMRLAKTQDVYVVAHLSSGEFYISNQNVEVLIGGCGTE